MTRSIETRTELISFDDSHDVVYCEVKTTDEHLLEDAIENVRATSELVAGRRVFLLLDLRATVTISREAREYYAGPVNAKIVRATAMLINSSVGRIIGNFILRVNRPPFPFRLFSARESAEAWFHELRGADPYDGHSDL